MLHFRVNRMKSCSFFGHRDTPKTEELKQKVRITVERLIVEDGVDTFLFGSRSKFDELCHMVVTELKEKYPHIRRVAYLCKHEAGCLVGTGEEMRQAIKRLTGRNEYVREFEEIKRSDRVDSAGRAAYVERNQWMINNSEMVVICACLEKMRRRKSGTMLAFSYAQEKNRKVVCL